MKKESVFGHKLGLEKSHSGKNMEPLRKDKSPKPSRSITMQKDS